MLVLSRKENESITIEPQEGLDPSLTLAEVFAQGPIVLTLTHVGPRRVRIVVAAPRALKVLRSETIGCEAQSTPPASPRIASGQ